MNLGGGCVASGSSRLGDIGWNCVLGYVFCGSFRVSPLDLRSDSTRVAISSSLRALMPGKRRATKDVLNCVTPTVSFRAEPALCSIVFRQTHSSYFFWCYLRACAGPAVRCWVDACLATFRHTGAQLLHITLNALGDCCLFLQCVAGRAARLASACECLHVTCAQVAARTTRVPTVIRWLPENQNSLSYGGLWICTA
jgi:hypothetical protein